jgi:hypothetical protein
LRERSSNQTPKTFDQGTTSRDRRDLPTTVTVTMASTSDAPLAFLHKNPVFSGISDVYNAFQERRERLGLSNPGVVENIAKGTSQELTGHPSRHVEASGCAHCLGALALIKQD